MAARGQRRVYLDHAATTPVLPGVARRVCEMFTLNFGNASSIHDLGVQAHGAMEEARDTVARFINARPGTIIFTSSGTESDNLAIQGFARKHHASSAHFITSITEHPAVHNTFKFLESLGYRVTYLPVDIEGVVDLKALDRAFTAGTRLVSIHHANNETGTVQPVREIAEIAARHGAAFHTDAVQSLGKVPIDVEAWNVSMLTGSGHKLHAPKGAGFLHVLDPGSLQSIMHGGDQERRLRPSTENVPAIVGMAEAMKIITGDMEGEAARQRGLREHLIDRVLAEVPGSRFNGSRTRALPGIASFSFEGANGFELVLALDREGFAVSPGSACHSRVSDPSRVLLALGLDAATANSTIRVSLGRGTTREEIDGFLEALPGIVAEVREP